MKKFTFKSALIVLLMGASFASYSQIINTFAGNGYDEGTGNGGYSGDGGQATAAELDRPLGLTLDAPGNIYTADENNNVIRIVNTSGVINTFAGNGVAGYTGNGGDATAAELYTPAGVAVDASGNIYIADQVNNVVRFVNTSGIINTFAGNGYEAGIGLGGYSGDGGPATAAELYYLRDITLDASGNVYIADTYNNCIRIVNTSGIINTFAGNGYDAGTTSGGYSGDGGPATAAELYFPTGVVVDVNGNVYIADEGNSRIRIVNTSGVINTFAGNGIDGYSGDGGQATAAELYYPVYVTLDASGNVYIADAVNNAIRRVNTSGIISTFAGNGYDAGTGSGGYSGDGGQATAAELYLPDGIVVNASGNVYISDAYNNRVREVTGISTGISELSFASNEVNVYPVPNTGYFTVSGVTQGQVIELYNYLGQQIANSCQLMANSQPIHFNISNYANGIYLIRILNKDGTVVTQKKIVKTE